MTISTLVFNRSRTGPSAKATSIGTWPFRSNKLASTAVCTSAPPKPKELTKSSGRKISCEEGAIRVLENRSEAKSDCTFALMPTAGQWRDRFHIPKINGKEAVYFTGNSLGLMPKTASAYVQKEMNYWAELGVEGHFHGSAWKSYHHLFSEKVGRLVGAKPEEVVMMNTLTVNLHLMMVSFYRPTKTRFKIIMEGGAFPSDQYAVESQVTFHGFAEHDAIVELVPRDGESTLRTEDILETIEREGESVALVMLGGVNYYTGQAYELEAITKAGHNVGAKVGFDLAHAVGNIALNLHDTGCDFAVWCTYKYLNSGPGGVSGVFVHERHHEAKSFEELPRFAGWWGHDEAERFLMKKGFKPMKGAASWQLSNAQILPMAAHMAALDEIDFAGGMKEISALTKELVEPLLEGLDEVLDSSPNANFAVLTPKEFPNRGCQTSILINNRGKELFNFLETNGIISDWREPNVIRIAPVPLYNTAEEVNLFIECLNAFYNSGS